jgi:pimeloyl-ACP methyl ester carboxylesterase
MKSRFSRIALVLMLVPLGLVLVLLVAGGTYTPKLEIPPGFAGKYVEVSGLKLRVHTEGAGRDLLFIHGSSGIIEDFAPQAKELAKSFRVTRYDRPSHGFSSVGERVSLAYNAQIAAALMDKLALQRAIVIGHSYGGATAMALALQRPARVSAYIAIDSPLYESGRPLDGRTRLMGLPLIGPGFLRIIPRERVRLRIAQTLPQEFRARPPPAGFIELRSKVWSEPKVTHALARERLLVNAELDQQSPRYSEIKAPVYVLAQRDSAPRRNNAERFKRALPHAVMELVPNSGHYIQIERPDVVTNMIRRAASEH